MIVFALAFLLAAGVKPLAAQTEVVEEIEFPQWSKDLRRAEIVAFGTIPFSWLVSTVCMDISRTINHGGDEQYLPWPLKPAGAPAMTNDEFVMTIGISLGISALIAVVDHVIIKYKRYKAEKLKLMNSPREPITIRRPVSGGFNDDTGYTDTITENIDAVEDAEAIEDAVPASDD
ncbi:MAG: hypothetical protein LBB22_01035 [Treponema sp.]|jgi:hypothetical protein|nr:hypothetical protein [Treponema sp.]